MSFSLKVIACLQSGPWNFWKLQNCPFLPPPPPALFLAAVHRQRRPPASWRGFPAIPAITSPRAGTHASPRSSSPSCCLALELPRPSHAPRRFQSRPGGRHRYATMDSPGQRPPHPSSERPSPTRTPEVDSIRSFALSSLSHRRTPPPPRLNPGELTSAAEPPHRRSSAHSDPLASSAVSPRNSQTTSPRPNLTGAPSPSFASAVVALSAVDHPSPAVSPRTKGT